MLFQINSVLLLLVFAGIIFVFSALEKETMPDVVDLTLSSDEGSDAGLGDCGGVGRPPPRTGLGPAVVQDRSVVVPSFVEHARDFSDFSDAGGVSGVSTTSDSGVGADSGMVEQDFIAVPELSTPAPESESANVPNYESVPVPSFAWTGWTLPISSEAVPRGRGQFLGGTTIGNFGGAASGFSAQEMMRRSDEDDEGRARRLRQLLDDCTRNRRTFDARRKGSRKGNP